MRSTSAGGRPIRKAMSGGKNRRKFDRLKHRVACELFHSGHRTTGMILDLSPTGLFVRTSTGTAPKDAGTEVRVIVKAEEGEIELLTRLARAHVVRRELVSAADGGFGLEITAAPPAYYELVQSLS